jgi:hypothetical protein
MRWASGACLLATLVLAVGSAPGQTVRAGSLIVKIDGAISPAALPRSSPAPITLRLSGSLAMADGSHPPALSSLRLDFDRHGHLVTRGLATCSVGRLENTLTSQARRACGKALVGTGRVGADIAFPEQAPFAASGPLLIFTGRPNHGARVLSFHAYARVPAPTTFVTTGVIKRSRGIYGTSASVRIPTIVGGRGSLTFFRTKLRRTWRFKGRTHHLLLASCPTGHLYAHGDFVFADGSRLAGKVTRSCRPLARTAARPFASPSAEGELTRQGYREAAEPICEANARANERILRHVRSDFRADRLAWGGRSMLRAAGALEKTYKQLRELPRPSGDAARLGRWLAKVRFEADLFRSAGKALKTGRKGRASALVVKLNQNATKANNLVIAFAFRSCRFEPSKYT